MLDAKCPKCGKNDKSQVIEINPETRTYTFKCGHCGKEFVLVGGGEEGEEDAA